MKLLSRIGTRGSPLARTQTEMARARLAAAEPSLANAIEVVVIRTTGDVVQDRPLAEIGGKGLFTKEIDAAMLAGAIDFAVHSVKDLPTALPDGIVLGAVLPREDPRDALIAGAIDGIAALPKGALVGTASLRRAAQLLARRPDLRVEPLRGNIHGRLTKVANGVVAATFLALAGLKRLSLADQASAILDPEEMLPAVGQGAVGVTCRADNAHAQALLAAIDDRTTHVAITAERAMLSVLDGSCRTPIAGLAEIEDGRLTLRGLVATPDGARVLAGRRSGALAEAEHLGEDLGRELRRRAGPGFFGD